MCLYLSCFIISCFITLIFLILPSQGKGKFINLGSTAVGQQLVLQTLLNTVLYTIPQHTVPYNTIPQHTVPYNTIPQHTVAYNAIPQHTVPYIGMARNVSKTRHFHTLLLTLS